MATSPLSGSHSKATNSYHFNIIPDWYERLLGWVDCKMRNFSEIPVASEHPNAQLINSIANRLLPHVWSDPEIVKQRADIQLIQDDKEVNACALLGTMNIRFYTGLLKKIQKAANKDFGDPNLAGVPPEDLVASVMAHEMAHALEKHVARKVSLFIALTGPIAVVASAIQAIAFAALDALVELLTSAAKTNPLIAVCYYAAKPFAGAARFLAHFIFALPALIVGNGIISQRYELEADRLGMELLKKADYNPKAMVWMTHFFADMYGSVAKAEPSTFWKIQRWISTHPIPTERIAAAEAHFEKLSKAAAEKPAVAAA